MLNCGWDVCAVIQEKRLKLEIDNLERDKGVKLRVLAQSYPQTPGMQHK